MADTAPNMSSNPPSPDAGLSPLRPQAPAMQGGSPQLPPGMPHNAMPAGPDQQKAQLLSQLHGIAAPEEVSWWPPAVGWWVVLALVLALLGFIGRTLWKKWRQKLYRKQALAALSAIKTADSDQPPSITVQQLMALLKQTFFSAYPDARTNLSGIYGESFLKLLDETTTRKHQFQSLQPYIERVQYTPHQDSDIQQHSMLLAAAQQWIQHHKTLSPSQAEARFIATLGDTYPKKTQIVRGGIRYAAV